MFVCDSDKLGGRNHSNKKDEGYEGFLLQNNAIIACVISFHINDN